MKRNLSPSTNLLGLLGAANALWALGFGLWNLARNHVALDPQVLATGIAAISFFIARFTVTPVKDPKNGAGEPLKTASQLAAERLSELMAKGVQPQPVVLPMPKSEPDVQSP